MGLRAAMPCSVVSVRLRGGEAYSGSNRSNPARPSLQSGRPDSNWRPPAPKAGALPDCATPRKLLKDNMLRTCPQMPPTKAVPKTASPPPPKPAGANGDPGSFRLGLANEPSGESRKSPLGVARAILRHGAVKVDQASEDSDSPGWRVRPGKCVRQDTQARVRTCGSLAPP